MTPGTHADLVARLDAVAEKWDGVFWRNLNDPTADDRYVSREQAQAFRDELAALRKALAALPPPADPPTAATLPKSMADHVVGMDRDGNLLVKVSNVNAAGNTDTGIYAFSPPRPADPPALVALRKSLLTGLEAIRQFASPHAEHTNRCNGDDDTPCDCGAINPRDVAESLYEQVLAYTLPAAPPVPASTPTYIEIDDYGDISIDFDRDRHNVCSLTIYQDGRVGYSAILDGQSAHGIVSAAEPMPSWVRAAICAPPVTDTPQGNEADDDPTAWFPSPDVRCIICGHLKSVHLAKRGRCLSLNAVEGGSVPCACAAFVVDMVDALRNAYSQE